MAGTLGKALLERKIWAKGCKLFVSMAKPSSLLDTRVVYCGDNLEQLKKLPNACIDLIYIDPPFNSNRTYEIFWVRPKEKRSFEDRHESTRAYIEFMRPRCVELARVLKMTGSFYCHCDWHASHYVKVMLDQIFGENNFITEIIWHRALAKGLAFKSFPTITTRYFSMAAAEKPSSTGPTIRTIWRISMRKLPANTRIATRMDGFISCAI
jgi:hypothetical protein